MKRIICILLICITFCSCGVSTGDRADNSQNSKNLSDSADSASKGAAAVVGSAPTAGAIPPEKIIARTVIDETGKKRKLKLGDVDAGDCGDYLIISDPAAVYSQISDGHYYYMRSNGEGVYAVYRDKGEKIGEFSVGISCGFIKYFVKYKGDFYAAFYEHEYDLNSDDEKYTVELIKIDLENDEYTVLQNEVWDWEKYDGMFSRGIYFHFYRDAFYFDTGHDTGATRLINGDPLEYFPGKLMKTDQKGNKAEIPATPNMDKAKPCLTFIDGKIYYGSQKEKTVNLYSYDLESGTENEVLCYKRTNQSSVYGYLGDEVHVSMDSDYIYCQDYIIPRKGGKMIRLFKDALPDGGTISFSSNSKYIYYIDKNYRVRRFDKRKKQTITINSKIKAMDVKCTEKGVYVQKYEKKLVQDDDDDDEGCLSDELRDADDPRTCDVYYMDLDGKNMDKIAD